MMDGAVLKSLSLTGTLGIYANGASTPNIELDQNGWITCSDFQLDCESGNGFNRYGVNTAGSRMLTSSITQSGAMRCTSLAITGKRSGFTGSNATLDQNGDLDCKDIVCNSIAINYARWQPTIETVVLNCVNQHRFLQTQHKLLDGLIHGTGMGGV